MEARLMEEGLQPGQAAAVLEARIPLQQQTTPKLQYEQRPSFSECSMHQSIPSS